MDLSKSTSSFLSEQHFCHNISVENYFMSPKMPIKDHCSAFRSTKSSFKQPPSIDHKQKQVLKGVDLNQSRNKENLMKSMALLKDLNLLKSKGLLVVTHQGLEKNLNSNNHSQQTNPGYSRNKLGGVYTK